MFRRFAPILAATSLICASAIAADAPAPITDIPPALDAPIKTGMSIVKKAEGPSGLMGYLLKDASDTYYTFWVTSDGKYLLAGALIDSEGSNLTAAFQDKYEPKVDLTAMYPKLDKASPITTGAVKPKTVIYAFVDPNCPYCHLLWLGAKPYEAAGLQIRWIETGFLHGDDSMGKAAAIMTSTDRVTTYNDSQGNFSANAGIKALSPAEVPVETATLLKENLSLMHSFGFKGVPGIVYKDSSGAIHTKDGMLKLSELAGIAGVPVQPETDPALERFK